LAAVVKSFGEGDLHTNNSSNSWKGFGCKIAVSEFCYFLIFFFSIGPSHHPVKLPGCIGNFWLVLECNCGQQGHQGVMMEMHMMKFLAKLCSSEPAGFLFLEIQGVSIKTRMVAENL
jgi:hypothetical protein